MSEVVAPLRIDRPGIYSLTAEQYHADPCVVPSLSRSIARLLVDASPAHAAASHPRITPDAMPSDLAPEHTRDPEAAAARDIGTAAHSLFLRGEGVAELVDFATYASKAAKEQRDAILAAGKVPLKRKDYDGVMRLVESLETFRARTGAFTRGRAEQTVIWQEGDIWCRCMPDWLPDDPEAPLWDLKTTAGHAVARTWSRACFANGGDLQSVFYPRGCAAVRDGVVPQSMKFAVIETKPPRGIKVFELDLIALDIGNQKVSTALGIWDQCTTQGTWPSYPLASEMIEAPIFVQREWDWRQRAGFALLGEDTPSDNRIVTQMLVAGNLGG